MEEPAEGSDGKGAGRSWNPLTMSELETLAVFAEMVSVREAEKSLSSQRKKPELFMKDVAVAVGRSPTTVTDRIRALEKPAGTYFLPRKSAEAPSPTRRHGLVSYPEDFVAAGGPESDNATAAGATDPYRAPVEPSLTLDGEIWATYADLVVKLRDLTLQATAKLAPEPLPEVPEKRRIKLPKGTPRRSRKPAPSRSSEHGRRNYLAWLRQHLDLVEKAHDFLLENGRATPMDLNRLLPGYEPGPEEVRLYVDEEEITGYPPGY